MLATWLVCYHSQELTVRCRYPQSQFGWMPTRSTPESRAEKVMSSAPSVENKHRSKQVSNLRGLVLKSLRSSYPQSQDVYQVPLASAIVESVDQKDVSAIETLKAEVELTYVWLTKTYKPRSRALLSAQDREHTSSSLQAYLSFLRYLMEHFDGATDLWAECEHDMKDILHRWKSEGIDYTGVESDQARVQQAINACLSEALLQKEERLFDPESGLVSRIGDPYRELLARYPIDDQPMPVRGLHGLLSLTSYTVAAARSRSGNSKQQG